MLVVDRGDTTSVSTAEADLLPTCALNGAKRWGLSVNPASGTCTVKVYKDFGTGLVLVISGSATHAAPYVLEFGWETANTIRVTGAMDAGTVAVTWSFLGKTD